jgi:putative transposase
MRQELLACKFRPYPNKEERELLWTKYVCRLVHSKFLELYNGGERDRGILQALLPVWKESDADIRGVHSKVLQYKLHRFFSNLAALDEMRKRGRKVGKLRFKGHIVSELSITTSRGSAFRATRDKG